MSNDNGKQIKRKRPSSVCNTCKKRKVKCDRKLPCSSCIKVDIEKSCSYEWSSSKKYSNNNNVNGISINKKRFDAQLNLEENPSSLKDYVANVHDSSKDVINFYEYVTSHKESIREINYGPLAWTSLLIKDNNIWLLKRFLISQKNERSMRDRIKKNLSDIPASSEKNFQVKLLEAEGIVDLLHYNDKLKNTKINEDTNNGFAFNDLTLGLTISKSSIDDELRLIEKIKSVLPSRKVMWILIKRFFRYVYPFMPFLDEFNFRHEIENIIGPLVMRIRISRKFLSRSD